MKEAEILQLFRSEQQRDAAFTALVDLYQDRIYRHMYSMSGNRQDAEDLTQNVFIKIWNNLSGFRAESGLYTWIYRIAANEALALIRKRKNAFAVSIDDDLAALDEKISAPGDVNPDQVNARLNAALERLPARQKQVFLLRYNEEMSYAKMAEVLGKTEGALKASYHHAVKKIEEQLRSAQIL